METVQVELWVMLDENGDYVAHEDRDGIGAAWEERVGDQPAADVARRVVRVTLTVPKPKPVELAASVAAEPEAGELKAV